MAFSQDGTKLASYLLNGDDPIRIWDIVDLTANKWFATRGYELTLRGIKDGWMMSGDYFGSHLSARSTVAQSGDRVAQKQVNLPGPL